MLVEALVIATCVQQGGGCPEATSAYYQYNKDAQVIFHKAEAYGNRIIRGNEWLVYVVSPLYSALSGKPTNIHVYKGYVLTLDAKQQTVAVTWSY